MDRDFYLQRFQKESSAHAACNIRLPGANFIDVNPPCFGYQQTSLRIFNLTQLHIDYGLATCFGPYLDHQQLLYKTFKTKSKSGKENIYFVYEISQLHIIYYVCGNKMPTRYNIVATIKVPTLVCIVCV